MSNNASLKLKKWDIDYKDYIPNLQVWVDANDESTYDKTGTTVNSITGKGLLGVTFSQSTESEKPSFSSNIPQNNNNCLTFLRSNSQFLASTAEVDFLQGEEQQVTHISVFRQNNIVYSNDPWAWNWRQNNNNSFGIKVESSDNQVEAYVRTVDNRVPDVELDIDTIVWQSGNTVRYTFNASPDLSGTGTGNSMLLRCTGCANSVNNGQHVITGFDDVTKWVDVTNNLVSSGATDEASDSSGVGEIWDALVLICKTDTNIILVPDTNWHLCTMRMNLGELNNLALSSYDHITVNDPHSSTAKYIWDTKNQSRNMHIGARVNSAGSDSNYWDGDIGEFMIFNRKLTTEEHGFIVGNLLDKWGINKWY